MSDPEGPEPRSEPIAQVERPVPGGESLARLPDGKVLFVAGAVAGDSIRVLASSEHKGFARATRWELVSASPDRREPPCPIAEQCGGCDWMKVDESVQAAHKLELVRDALRRVGKLQNPPPIDWIGSAASLGYRSRIRLHIATDGALCYRARASHELVPVAKCVVASADVNRALERVTAFFRDGAAALARRLIGEVELRALAPKPELRLIARAPLSKSEVERLGGWVERLRTEFVVSLPGADLDPTSLRQVVPLQRQDTAIHVASRISPTVFTQVNWEINELLVRDVLAMVRERGHTSFVDLYTGNGNLALPLLAAGLRGVGIEFNAEAIACAETSAREQHLDGVFRAADVATEVRRMAKRKERFDLVLIDPPRAGAGKLMSEIAQLTRRDLFYCACDPVSLARDLRWLLANGFELLRLSAYDMFPQTHHVETSAWLTRASGAR